MIAAPSGAAQRVTIGPAAEWVKERAVDESFRQASSYSILLIDRQHHASRGEAYHRILRRMETRQAVQEFGQWKLEFDPATQHVVIHSLVVRRDGKTVDYAKPENLRFMQREGELELLVVSGHITIVVLLEDVRIGDFIDVSYTIRSEPRLFKDRISLISTVPFGVALRAFHFSMRFAEDRALQWKSNDPAFAPEVAQLDGEIEWSWKKENLQREEIEDGVPLSFFAFTWIEITDFKSWAEVSSGVAAAWHEDFENANLTETANAIAAAEETPAGRAARAIAFVQDDIRYLSVAIDFGGQIPSPPGTVLTRCYGDCKDKSFLLAHLLRLLGIGAQPVLVNTFWRESVAQFLPTASAFNHVIVKLEIDGRTCWIDSTTPLQGGDVLQRAAPDFRIGLPVGAEGCELEEIPVDPAAAGTYELRERFLVESRTGPGNAFRPSTLQVTLLATGLQADRWRQQFAHEGIDEVSRKREHFYKQYFPELQRTGALIWEDDRVANRVKLVDEYSIPKALYLVGGTAGSVSGPRYSLAFSAHVIQSVLGFNDTGGRKYPLALRYPCELTQIIEVLSTSWQGDQFPLVLRKNDIFEFNRSSPKNADCFTLKYTVKTFTGVVQQAEFEKHRETVKKLWNETAFRFWVRPGHAPTKPTKADFSKFVKREPSPEVQRSQPRESSRSSGSSHHRKPGWGQGARKKKPSLGLIILSAAWVLALVILWWWLILH